MAMVGRPTKYSEDLQARADEYIYDYDKVGDVIPSRAGLCCYLGICIQTSHYYEKDYPEFSNVIRDVDALQHRTLLNRGLDSTFNSTVTKLILSRHGYSEKTETDITSGGEKIKNEWHIHPVSNDK